MFTLINIWWCNKQGSVSPTFYEQLLNEQIRSLGAIKWNKRFQVNVFYVQKWTWNNLILERQQQAKKLIKLDLEKMLVSKLKKEKVEIH